MNEEARRLIAALSLEPLAGEGGFFRRVHTFFDESGAESGSTILYLMAGSEFSALHKLQSDEVWTFLEGDPVEQLTIDDTGKHSIVQLGKASEGKSPVSVVKAGHWQATKPITIDGWALCTATMVPPWDEKDFVLADQKLLDRLAQIDEVRRFIKEK